MTGMPGGFKNDFDPHAYLLLLRYAVLNIASAAAMTVFYFQGFIGKVIDADRTRIVLAIAALFLVGFLWCTWKIWQTSREINHAKLFSTDRYHLRVPKNALVREYFEDIENAPTDGRSIFAAVFQRKLAGRIVIIRYLANSLVTIGLIGTVVGFIIALSGVDPNIATDVKAIVPMASELVAGLSVALYTTLVGSVLYLWLNYNYWVLATGTNALALAVIKLGEQNG